MKLEIEHKGAFQRVEVRREKNSDVFELKLENSGPSPETVSVRLLGRSGDRWTLEIDGRVEDVVVSANGSATLVEWNHRTFPLRVWSQRERLLHASEAEMAGAAELKAMMPGKVIAVLKKEGDSVASGEGLVIIESMKMQNELRSPKSGQVAVCGVQPGGSVNAGDLLFRIE